MTKHTILPLRCPSCGGTASQPSREMSFGAEFRCDHCGVTSVLIIDQALVPLGTLQKQGEKVCVTCGRVALREARFCQAGHSLVRKCVYCALEFPVEHQLCDFCGKLQANWKAEAKQLLVSGDWDGAFGIVAKATGEFPLSQQSMDLMDSWRYTESEMEERRRRSEEAKCVFCGVNGRPKGADTHQCDKCGRWFCYHCEDKSRGDTNAVFRVTRCKEHPPSKDRRGFLSFFRE